MNDSTDNDQPPTIDCKSLEKFVVEFLDGQLPKETRLAFLEHIEECKHCEEYLQSYQQTIALSKAALIEGDGETSTAESAIPEKLVEAILAASRKTQ